MPTINFNGFDGAFNQSTGWVFQSYVAHDDDFYSWVTSGGYEVTVTGAGFTVDESNRPIGGIITQVDIVVPGENPTTIDVVVEDVENADFADIGFMNTAPAARAFWDEILKGDTRITSPDPGNDITVFSTAFILSNGLYFGDNSTIRGIYEGGARVTAVTEVSANAYLEAGVFNFRGSAGEIAPVTFAISDAIVIGNDDRIVLIEATPDDIGSTDLMVFGDAAYIGDDAYVEGGNDVIDARDAGDGFVSRLYGDASSVQSSAFLKAGDDLIYGTNRGDGTGTNVIYGDVRTNADYGLVGGDDTLYGRAGDDAIYGDTASRSSQYVGGNDIIYGGSDGNDFIYGGRGNDRIYVGKGKVQILAEQDDDKVFLAGGGSGDIFLGSGDDFIRVSGGIGGNSPYQITGNDGIDRISFTSADGDLNLDLSDIAGHGGVAEGMFIYEFEEASGTMDGDNTIYGNDGDNNINTFNGDDRIYGGAGNDDIETGAGDDYIKAGSGENTYDGGAGRDTISYYDSNAGVRIDLKREEFSGGFADGDEIIDIGRVTGTRFSDRLYGLDGGNILKGGAGNDSFWGRDGTDKIYGGSGADFLNGGDGTDYLFGGSGADTFHFDRTEDRDIIKDFQNNADRIEFDGFAAGFDPFDFAEQDGDDVVFDLAGSDELVVEDALIGQLRNDVFVV